MRATTSLDIGQPQYLKVGDVHLAYQVVGDGPIDLVHIPGIFSHLEWQWAEPGYAHFLQRLASFSRLVMFDARGLGLSDRMAELPILEQQMEDLTALLDAVGSERAVLFGVSQGGPMAALYAATHPQRVSSLILYGSYAVVRMDSDNPHGRSPEWLAEYLRQIDQSWGTGTMLPQVAPTRSDDDDFRAWWGSLERFAAGPGNALTWARMNMQIDIRPALASISAPTLVVQRRGDTYRDPRNARYLSTHIPDATLLELPGIDHLPYVGDADRVVEAIEEFVTGERTEQVAERELATVLFVDVVGSTEHASRLGDREWSRRLKSFVTLARQEVRRSGGELVDTAGDGLLCRFGGPARAIQCAMRIRDGVKALGFEVRAGPPYR